MSMSKHLADVLVITFFAVGYYRKEIFAKYSDANMAYMDRYLAYMFCFVLFDPKNIQKSEDKINAIQEFRRQQQPPISQTLPLTKELPDVALRFVYPKSPALVLVNQSAVIARDIKWTVVLWNMDLPDRNDPLPIPVSTFDWITDNSMIPKGL